MVYCQPLFSVIPVWFFFFRLLPPPSKFAPRKETPFHSSSLFTCTCSTFSRHLTVVAMVRLFPAAELPSPDGRGRAKWHRQNSPGHLSIAHFAFHTCLLFLSGKLDEIIENSLGPSSYQLGQFLTSLAWFFPPLLVIAVVPFLHAFSFFFPVFSVKKIEKKSKKKDPGKVEQMPRTDGSLPSHKRSKRERERKREKSYRIPRHKSSVESKRNSAENDAFGQCL